jgi:adenylate kinase family enzyme
MIILIRGFPGSGKSTLARKMLNFLEKTVHPNMSKEDIEWHLNLFRQSRG